MLLRGVLSSMDEPIINKEVQAETTNVVEEPQEKVADPNSELEALKKTNEELAQKLQLLESEKMEREISDTIAKNNIDDKYVDWFKKISSNYGDGIDGINKLLGDERSTIFKKVSSSPFQEATKSPNTNSEIEVENDDNIEIEI